jgi:hypothetical protein
LHIPKVKASLFGISRPLLQIFVYMKKRLCSFSCSLNMTKMPHL